MVEPLLPMSPDPHAGPAIGDELLLQPVIGPMHQHHGVYLSSKSEARSFYRAHFLTPPDLIDMPTGDC